MLWSAMREETWMNTRVSRREFLQCSPATAVTGALMFSPGHAAPPSGASPGPFRGTLCLFSKPVPQLDWRELAQSAKRAGFGGIDLTVRRGGGVPPQRAAGGPSPAVSANCATGVEG